MDIKGKIHQQKYSGFNACIIQHEIDHLNGILFVDYLSPLKRQRIKEKLMKVKKHMEKQK